MWRKTQLKRRKLLRRASLREWHKKLGKEMASKRIFYLFGLISRNPWGNSKEDGKNNAQVICFFGIARHLASTCFKDTERAVNLKKFLVMSFRGFLFLKKILLEVDEKTLATFFFHLPFHHEIPVSVFFLSFLAFCVHPSPDVSQWNICSIFFLISMFFVSHSLILC